MKRNIKVAAWLTGCLLVRYLVGTKLANKGSTTRSYFMKQLYKLSLQVLLTLIISLATINYSFAGCTPHGDQVSYGANNKWTGYLYQGVNFNKYIGYSKEGNGSSPNFDERFGGSQVNYNTNGCDVYTDTFSVRYKLTKTFSNGYYEITVGGDDGCRLSVDGGNTWIINNWSDQSYTTSTYTVQLNGSVNLVLEYYERFGDNRVSFSIAPGCAPSGDPAVAGNGNIWQAYLYQGNNFQTYRGFKTEGSSSSPNFDENFGGANTLYGTSSCGVQTENFSARFRLSRNFAAATYLFVVGGDDGYRLSLDGGNTWVINNWNAHSYTTSTYAAFLSGTVNMVIEYFENGGDNRISFAMTSNGSLPVKLAGISAKAASEDKVQVNWKVTEEVNFSHYVIQRATGGQAFTDIAVVAGQETDIHKEISYQYTDHLTYSGLVHYRLKMVDKDARAEYSSVVTVSLNIKEGSVKIYPTIIESGNLYVETADKMEKGVVEIIDMHGRKMLQQNNISGGRNQVLLGSARLAAGSYVVRVMNGNKLVVTKKVIVK
jgi:hypothetical protein